ncbi:DNA cytosine methyltransferase [Aerosakkonema funiforme]|uniref:DNA cytosine methyltransferase n=1 Tax=Aerosakkonema funiforme TaxID=1246630 RepID=UPI0035BAD231
MDKLLVKDFGQKYSDKHKPPAATMRYPPPHTKLDGTSLKEQSPPPWATAPKPVLPPDAPTAGYLCGGGGIMTAGFETAGIGSLWNIDHDNSDPLLSQAIAQIYQTNFHHPVIRQTLQKVAASGRFNDLPTPDILVLTQPCKHLSKSNPKAKETQSDIDTAAAAIKAFQTFHSPVLIIENVPEYQQSTSWQLIKTALIDLDYQFTAKILNTADFGIPQQRHRFLAIAVRGSRGAGEQGSRGEKFPILPQPTSPQPIGWYEAICDLLPHLEDIHPTPAQLQRLTNLPSHFLQQPLLIERVGAYGNPKVRLPHETCWTIRKSIWLDQRHNSRANAINIRLPDGNWKNLGIQGAARLMTLPDWFWLPDEAWISGSAIGNGVPSLLAAIIAKAVKPYLPTAYPVSFSHKKAEVPPAVQESTSNKNKKSTEILTQNQPTGSITMQATTNSAKLDNYNFPPLTSTQTIALAREIVELGFTHAGAIAKLKEQALELGYKLLELETALGESELKELLKHCFPKEIVRYYRNILAQAKLLEKCPQLYDKILNMPICHAAALLAGTETQIEQILNEDTKWTISLIKQRVKAENSSPPSIPEIAIGKPVKILASDSEHSGNIALVQNIQDEEVISVQLLSGELKEFFQNEVKPIDPDTYQELNTILSTSLNLHDQFKTAANQGDESLTNEIESKLTKLDKCRRQLSTRLGLSDKAINNLSNTIANNHTELSQTIISETECDRTFQVWNLKEEEKEPIIAKAQLLAKLRTHEVDAQPTTGEMALAIASYLHKSNTKHNGGGIPITTREYSELTELIQQQNSTIRQLKAELDEAKSHQQQLNQEEVNTKLTQLQQTITEQAKEIERLRSENQTKQPDKTTAKPQPELNTGDVVRITTRHTNPAYRNKLGIFQKLWLKENWCRQYRVALILINPGTENEETIEAFPDAILPIEMTQTELQQLAKYESLAQKVTELTQKINAKEHSIGNAAYMIAKCLEKAGVPGWTENGLIDEEGNIISTVEALGNAASSIDYIFTQIGLDYQTVQAAEELQSQQYDYSEYLDDFESEGQSNDF